MIIWRGYGILCIPIMTLVVVVIGTLFNNYHNDSMYSVYNLEPKIWALVSAGIMTFAIGQFLNNRTNNIIRDPESGKKTGLYRIHDLWFIKYQYWALLPLLILWAVCKNHTEFVKIFLDAYK